MSIVYCRPSLPCTADQECPCEQRLTETLEIATDKDARRAHLSM